MSTVTETIHRVVCPHCEKPDKRVGHLFGTTRRSWGPWYCDHCGGSYAGTVGEDNEVTVEARETKKIDTLVLLRLEEDGPVALVVEGFRMAVGDDAGLGHHRYHYEEHTCPSNYHRHVKEVWAIDPALKNPTGIDEDPHGVFDYLAEEDLLEDESTEDAVKRLRPKFHALLGVPGATVH